MSKWNLIIDVAKCHDCNNCFLSCKDEFCENDFPPYSVAQPWHGHRWIDILRRERGQYPMVDVVYLPVPCMHCDRPPCLDACPLDAISRRNDGIVVLDEEKCDGCQACIPACPYDALVLDEGRNVARKCNLCAHRVDDGFEPFCAVCCETEAIYFGDLADQTSAVSNVVSLRAASLLRPEIGVGPGVYYCPTRQGRME